VGVNLTICWKQSCNLYIQGCKIKEVLRLYVYMYIYIYIYIFVCMCMYVFNFIITFVYSLSSVCGLSTGCS
jgi:hypothetical protein